VYFDSIPRDPYHLLAEAGKSNCNEMCFVCVCSCMYVSVSMYVCIYIYIYTTLKYVNVGLSVLLANDAA